MPIGSISMSDGKAGSIPPSDKKIPEALVQPFDGGLAFKDRCRHLPEALRKPKTKASTPGCRPEARSVVASGGPALTRTLH